MTREVMCVGMVPVCPTCGYVMRAEPMQKGDRAAIIWCESYTCSDKDRKFQMVLPTYPVEELK